VRVLDFVARKQTVNLETVLEKAVFGGGVLLLLLLCLIHHHPGLCTAAVATATAATATAGGGAAAGGTEQMMESGHDIVKWVANQMNGFFDAIEGGIVAVNGAMGTIAPVLAAVVVELQPFGTGTFASKAIGCFGIFFRRAFRTA
jgi:hypothetical protein